MAPWGAWSRFMKVTTPTPPAAAPSPAPQPQTWGPLGLVKEIAEA